VLDTLDAAAVRRWCGGGLAALRAHQHEIDELNVYPVPDGDTGTNLVLTLTSAQQALTLDLESVAGGSPDIDAVNSGRSNGADPNGADQDPADRRPADPGPGGPDADPGDPHGRDPHGRDPHGRDPHGRDSHGVDGDGGEQDGDGHGGRARTPLGHVLRLMARGALLGARGNSGVIVSQILRGMADSLAVPVVARGRDLAAALRSATEAAYAAVAKPVEGTVLSVVAAAADAATRIGSDDVVAVAKAAAAAAAEALARTPSQLPVLARAGVVDAGGRGLCVLLDALVEALDGGPRPDAGTADGSGDAGVHGGNRPAEADGPQGAAARQPGVRESGSAEFAYEVQYLLDAEPDAVQALRGTLGGLGDSLVVVGTGEGSPPTWNVHVHVNDIGAAIEAGVRAGRPYRIVVTRFADQPGGDRATDPAPGGPRVPVVAGPVPLVVDIPQPHRTVDVRARAAVVVAAGDGLTALFAAEGATVVGRNPSTAEVLDAIRSTGAGRVVLLPNDANTHAVATAAAREAATGGVRVSVVPTRSPVQALAALAVRDPERAFSDDVIAMAEAAGACRSGEVCTASREALTVAGRCRPGDLLGLVDGEVHVIGADLAQVCRQLLDRMLGGGGELATLVLGADAPPELEGVLRRHAAQVWPFVDLQCFAGGQPRYHLLVGVE
jgi:DAK2 domain fusion protein YloV